MAPEARFRVQRADERDIEDFARLRIELFEEAARPDPVREVEALGARTRAAYRRGIESRTLLVWMARSSSGEPIGSLAMHLFPRLPSPASPTGEEGYVVNVYTVPGWRRRGVGTALMQALIDESRRLGLGRLRLHTTSDGRHLYARFGFREYVDNMQLVL